MYNWVDAAIEVRNDKDPLPYAIRRLEDNRVIGSTRFWHAEFWNHTQCNVLSPRHPNAIEIGKTWLSRSARGTGCNTDAKLLMLTHAFEHWGVKRITMTTNSRDDRSRQSIERLGASLDGVMRAARPCPENIDGDIAVYTIIDSEWPTVRTRLQMAVQQQTMKHIISLDSSLAATHV